MVYDVNEGRIRLRAAMLPLIQEFSTKIEEKHLHIINEFVDNYEFPLALEWLYSVLIENSVVLTDHQYSFFKQLAFIMEVDLRAVK